MLQALIACTEQSEWEALARRRVCHFGYKFEYKVWTAFVEMTVCLSFCASISTSVPCHSVQVTV